jgi:hypothetical protein
MLKCRFEVADGRKGRCSGPPGQEGNEAGHPLRAAVTEALAGVAEDEVTDAGD